MKPGLFILILFLAVSALLLAVIRINNISISPSVNISLSPTPTPKQNIFGNEITYITKHKSVISATVYSPVNTIPPYKSLILVHQSDSDRSDWSILVPTLLDNGYRVLVFDLKGMGKSKSSIEQEPAGVYLDSLVGDLEASVEYIRNLPDTDKEHIGVIGASLGANVAYVYSGSDQNTVSATVTISASKTNGPLQGKNINNFRPSNIFFLTDQKDLASSQEFFGKSSNPKSIKIYPDSTAHGVELLKNPQTVTDILTWLKTSL